MGKEEEKSVTEKCDIRQSSIVTYNDLKGLLHFMKNLRLYNVSIH